MTRHGSGRRNRATLWRLALLSIVVLGGSFATVAESKTYRTVLDGTGDGGGHPYVCSGGTCGIAVDASGNAFVAGMGSDNVFKITPSGLVTEVIDATGDGAGSVLDEPSAIAVDADGNVFVAGYASDNVFRISPAGAITEIIDAAGDGAGHPLETPVGLDVDATGTVYVAGVTSDNVFSITSAGAITQILDAAGDGVRALSGPRDIAVDASGNVFVTSFNWVVFKIEPGGAVSSVLDSTGDGVHAMQGPEDLAVDGAGNLYVSAAHTRNLFKVTPGGVVTQLVDAIGDGAGHEIEYPGQLDVDAAGNVFLAVGLDGAGEAGSTVLMLTPSGGVIELMPESGPPVVVAPRGLRVDPTGGLFVSGAPSVVVKIEFDCTPAPRSSCLTPVEPRRSKLVMRSKAPIGDPSDTIVFGWIGGDETLMSDFGAPAATDAYALCIYDGTGAAAPLLVEATAPPGGTCAGAPCWSALGTTGFRYVNGGGTPDGLRKLVLKAGPPGKARMVAKAKGENLSFPSLPVTVPKTVQLQNVNGGCWSAEFDFAGVLVNDTRLFKSKGD